MTVDRKTKPLGSWIASGASWPASPRNLSSRCLQCDYWVPAPSPMRQMFSAEMRVIDMHAGLARKAFGPLGTIRLKERCCKKYGLRKGRLVGRSVWAWGCALEAIFSRLRREFDA